MNKFRLIVFLCNIQVRIYFSGLKFLLLTFIFFISCNSIKAIADVGLNKESFIICDPISDSLELVKLYNKLGGKNWRSNTNWLKHGQPISTWYGVSTDLDGCVSRLDLSSNYLAGIIYDFKFENISYLKLGNNQLKGVIPDFSNMPKLMELWLNGNYLIGSIPDFNNISKLEILFLASNQLSNNIPDFFNLPSLTHLLLFNNQLSGSIPDFSNLPNLSDLSLAVNDLSDRIPNFSKLQNLKRLFLYSNNLTGNIPDFSNLLGLNFLLLSNNKLSGSIPDFSNLTNLVELWVNDNQLSESIPNFSNLSQLKRLFLYNNQLSGKIPEFSNLPFIQSLDISNNKFTFSDFLPFNSKISYNYSPQDSFNLSSTFYSKVNNSIPIELKIDPNLNDNIYSWSKNNLPWQLPSGNSFNSNKLVFPNLESNDYGRYSVSVTNSRAPDLTLFGRTISIKVCNSEQDSLELLKLYNSTNGKNWNNKNNWLLQGKPISSWFGIKIDSLGCVRSIDINNNNLVGTIPELKINTLDTLILNNNSLSGNIPEMEIPFIQNLNLSNNQLTGSIPFKLKTWIDLRILNLGSNSLTGNIPPDLGDLCPLLELRINDNQFTGSLPEELTKLQNLIIGKVDFRNNFTINSKLKDKFIFFCPYGNEIFLNDSCHNRFLNICNIQCTGSEWDSMNIVKFKWITDTLSSLSCDNSSCIRSSITAGFVEVRSIKVIFIRTICYTNSDLSEFNEEVKFYDCGGHIIELVRWSKGLFYATYGDVNEAQMDSLSYIVKWSCGDSLFSITHVEDIYKTSKNLLPINQWIRLECQPNPASNFISCKIDESDKVISSNLYNPGGKRISISINQSNQFINLDLSNLARGIYFLEVRCEARNYLGRLIVL